MENEYGKQTAKVFISDEKLKELERNEQLKKYVDDGVLSEEILKQNQSTQELVYILMKAKDKKLIGDKLIEHLPILKSCFGSKHKSVNIINLPTVLLNMESGKPYNHNDPSINEDDLKDCKTMMVETRKFNLPLENKVLYDHLYIYSIELCGEKHDSLLVRLIETNLNKKKSTTFTISENVMEDFNKISDKLAINKSKFVENSIKAFIEKNK